MKPLDQFFTFKQTELGILPTNWQVEKLGNLTTHIIDCLHEKKPDFIDFGDKIYLEVFNIGKDGFIDLSKVHYVTDEVFSNWVKRLRPQHKDIVISKTGRVGAVAILPEEQNYCIGRNQVVIRSDSSKLLPEFLLLYLLSSNFQHELKRLKTDGTILQSLHVKYISQIRVPLPPLKEQKIIVNIAYSFMLKMKTNEFTNSLLESLTHSLFLSWFVRFDPFQYGEFIDSELGPIPKGWTIGRLEDVTEVIDCLHIEKPEREDKGNYLLQVYNIGENGKLDLTNPFFVSDVIYNIWISRIEVKKGDIIISKTGRVGAVAQIPNIRAAIGRNLVCIRPNSDIMNPEYLKELLLSRFMKNEIKIRTSSGTILQSLHVKDIKKLRIIVPPEKISKDFQDIIEPLHERIITTTEENHFLSSLRDLLLPQLLSGKLKIKNPEQFSKEIVKIS